MRNPHRTSALNGGWRRSVTATIVATLAVIVPTHAGPAFRPSVPSAPASAVADVYPSQAAGQGEDVAEQVRPVVMLLRAVRNGDREALMRAFCARLRAEFEALGWAQVLQGYQDGFRQQFGQFELTEFTFAFAGGDDRGQVSITHRGGTLPALAVVREAGEWRLNER